MRVDPGFGEVEEKTRTERVFTPAVLPPETTEIVIPGSMHCSGTFEAKMPLPTGTYEVSARSFIWSNGERFWIQVE